MADLTDDLDEWMGDPDWELIDEAPDTMRPEDAERMIRVVRRAQQEVGEIDRLARIQRARVDAWETARAHRYLDRIETYTGQLERWARAQPGKVSSWDFPDGKLTLRAAPATGRVVIDDEAALLDALHGDHDELIKVTEKPAAAAIKAVAQPKELSDDEAEGTDDDVQHFHLVIDGEILPGVHLERDTRKRFGLAVTDTPTD